jgi:flavin reductase (DIM6/NTAB) family NADH-FMN oxidoreductase RutF
MKGFTTLNDLDLELLPRRRRGRLVNSLSGFKSANLVGTTSVHGVHNLSIISSVVHLGSDPALLGMVFRPPVDPAQGSHSYWNIRETGCFTLNHVPASLTAKAHQASARYPQDTDEFEALGFTPIFRCGFEAPAVEESPVRIGMERVDEWEIPQNRCRFVVAQIRWVEFPEEALCGDGYLDLEGLDVAALSSLDGYHRTQKLHRLGYAKPESSAPELMEDFMRGWKDEEV